jgi:hypothetical protein
MNYHWFKKTEALAPRTSQEYYIHFDYLKEFLGDDITNESVTLEVDGNWQVKSPKRLG